MHSDREKLVERLRHRAETMNGAHPVGAGDGGTYVCGYYSVADQKLDREAIAALSEPGEAVACKDEAHDHPEHIWRTACIRCGVFRGSDLYTHPAPEPLSPTERESAWGALRMIADAIGERFGPVASIESEDARLLRGPEYHHFAEGIVEAMLRIPAPSPSAGGDVKALRDALEKIRNYCDAPHWNANRRVTVRETANAALASHAPVPAGEVESQWWSYKINYGPDGEENYANVYAPSGDFVGNLKIHHARTIVGGLNDAALRTASPSKDGGSDA